MRNLELTKPTFRQIPTTATKRKKSDHLWMRVYHSLKSSFAACAIGLMLTSSTLLTASAQTINTLAGGGYTASVPVRQAPVSKPLMVARDPQGRGFYLLEEGSYASVIRFVNTSSQAVTLAGVTIASSQISTIAGLGESINDGSAAIDSFLSAPVGLIADGDVVYFSVSNQGGDRIIRAINTSTQSVTVRGVTIAAGAVATVHNTQQTELRSLVLKPGTSDLYFCTSDTVYRIDGNGNQTAFAGGGNPGSGNGDGGAPTGARLRSANGLAFNSAGDLLIAEGGQGSQTNGAVRRVSGGTISSLASGLAFPTAIAVASDGNAYITLRTLKIARVSATGAVTEIAGNGSACDLGSNPNCNDGSGLTAVSFNLPGATSDYGVQFYVDATGIVLPEFQNSTVPGIGSFARIRYVNLSTGTVTIAGQSVNAQSVSTIVGSGAPLPFDNVLPTYSELRAPTEVTADAQGNLFIADTGNRNFLRFINRGSGVITLFAGTPSATVVQPGQIVTLNRRNDDTTAPENQIIGAVFSQILGMSVTSQGVFIADAQSAALFPAQTGARTGLIKFLNTSAQAVTIFPNGGGASVTIQPGEIRRVVGIVSNIGITGIGDGGPANQAVIFPTDVLTDSAGNLYIADIQTRLSGSQPQLIRRVDASTGGVTSLTIQDASAATLTLNRPSALAFDGANRLLIADATNNRVLRQNAAGGNAYSIIADASTGLNTPRGVVVNGPGDIFVVSSGNHRVIKVTASGNSLGTGQAVAGTGTAGFSGDGGPATQARLNLSQGTLAGTITTGIVALSGNAIAFVDVQNSRVRSFTTSSTLSATSTVAASYSTAALAPDSIAAVFGDPLATGVAAASSVPLPTSLSGTTVKVRDSAGTERDAGLFFVSQQQVNYHIPPETVTGTATVTVTSGSGAVSSGNITVANVAPGIFTANASGTGYAAANTLIVRNGNLIYDVVAVFNPATSQYEGKPINLSQEDVFLILYGTGIRRRTGLSGVSVTINGVSTPALFADAQGLVGLDQINVQIPRSLAGTGDVNVVVTVDGRVANTVRIKIQ
jgi:uncharacterized protein (TIGR03437 family)